MVYNSSYSLDWSSYPEYARGVMPYQAGHSYPVHATQTPAAHPQPYTAYPMLSGGQAQIQPGIPTMPGTLPMEQSYIENILRLNLGKQATIYMTFEGNREWNAKIFTGVVEAAGRDHIIISDRETGRRYLLLMVNLDYITFDEELNYVYPFQAGYGPGTPTRDEED